jgi:hypothetical protein
MSMRVGRWPTKIVTLLFTLLIIGQACVIATLAVPQMAIDVLSIPALNCKCERMFSELGDLLEPTAADLTSVYSAYGGSIGLS